MKPSLVLQHSAQVLSKEGDTEKMRNLQFESLNTLHYFTGDKRNSAGFIIGAKM